MSPAAGAIFGSVIGAAYFALSESGVPKNSNCTYLAPWTTDLAAWTAGAVLLYRGWALEDSAISFIGATIIAIHIGQFAAHKVITNRISS